jgi:hypothetical protein
MTPSAYALGSLATLMGKRWITPPPIHELLRYVLRWSSHADMPFAKPCSVTSA